MSLSDKPLNSPLQIPISRDPPPGIDPKLVGIFEDIFNALYLIQVGFVNYSGIAPQDPDTWADQTPDLTILQQNMNRYYAKAQEPIALGQMVSIIDNAGVGEIRLADSSDNTRVCHGYCNTTGGINTGSYGEVIVAQGLVPGIAGLTPGVLYYLSETAGAITAVKPVGAGKIVQAVGVGMTGSLLYFNPTFQFLQL